GVCSGGSSRGTSRDCSSGCSGLSAKFAASSVENDVSATSGVASASATVGVATRTVPAPSALEASAANACDSGFWYSGDMPMFSLRKHPLTEDMPRKLHPTGKSKRGDAARANALYRQDDTRPPVALSTIAPIGRQT